MQTTTAKNLKTINQWDKKREIAFCIQAWHLFQESKPLILITTYTHAPNPLCCLVVSCILHISVVGYVEDLRSFKFRSGSADIPQLTNKTRTLLLFPVKLDIKKTFSYSRL